MSLLKHERHAILFLLRHLCYGVTGGLVFGGLVIYLDIAHLRSLAQESENGIQTLILLFFGLIVTFGSLGMAAGIMGLGQDDDT